jgi:uncharacterized membrane protein
MEAAKHHESREEFQLERFSFFSDGVFAISITLLVIEIKVPALAEHTDKALLNYLSETSFKFLGFLISFGIIGHYWSVHHRIFGYVKKYTSSLFWINLAFLLSAVLLPFSSGLLGEYSSHTEMNVPYIIYVLNMCFVGLTNWWLWAYVSKPERKMLTHYISPARIRLGVVRSLIVPIIFLVSLACSFIWPLPSRFIPILIPVFIHFGMKKLEQRANLQEVIVPEKEEEVEAPLM